MNEKLEPQMIVRLPSMTIALYRIGQ
jgi:hypothetical protein